MAKKTDHPPVDIDLASDAIVLEYVGGPAPSGVPARDLSGGDLGRQAYVEMLAELDHQDPDFKRPVATPARAADVAAALVAGGSFRAVKAASVPRETKPKAKPAAKPKAAAKPRIVTVPTSPTPPAEPAAEPEA